MDSVSCPQHALSVPLIGTKQRLKEDGETEPLLNADFKYKREAASD